MRTQIFIASLLTVLTGCKGKYDGSWLVSYTLRSDSENADNYNIGVEYRTFSSLYRTADQIAIEFGNTMLTGTRDGDSFEVSKTFSMDQGTSDCQVYMTQSAETITGQFSGDLSFEGEMEVTDRFVVQDCDWSDDADESQVLVYELTGVLLDSAPGAHGGSTVAWGYIPLGGY